MATHKARASDLMSDYANIRTIPAALGVAFVMASLYQFGGITTVDLPWLGYTLTTEHAALISVGAFAVAFASSETRQFENYEDWEQVAIAAGPIVILGNQYVAEINDFLVGLGDPLGLQLAFVVTVISWGVTVR